jgi:hypothetical protein
MRKLYFIFIFTFFLTSFARSQSYEQYFDGADTNEWNSLIINIDPDTSNIWQIGKPQKSIFDSASTTPNVIVTDTINYYPPLNTSSFTVSFVPWAPWGVLAVRWAQKLDLDTNHDGAIVEYTIDHGLNWNNVFNNPYVYNFYGFQMENQDTLNSGEYAFSGTDSSWRDIWLCFDMSFLSTVTDTISFRYTLKSDSIDNNREGWMIDNMWIQLTLFHTVKSEMEDYMKVYPTMTNGIVNIETIKIQDYHIIESIQLIDLNGRVVKQYGKSPTKFYLDISDQIDGMYYLKVHTNKQTSTYPIILRRE